MLVAIYFVVAACMFDENMRLAKGIVAEPVDPSNPNSDVCILRLLDPFAMFYKAALFWQSDHVASLTTKTRNPGV